MPRWPFELNIPPANNIQLKSVTVRDSAGLAALQRPGLTVIALKLRGEPKRHFVRTCLTQKPDSRTDVTQYAKEVHDEKHKPNVTEGYT
jgi:hypothetical protein